MKTRPVRRYSPPAYPTRLELLMNPRRLTRNLPGRWRERGAIAGAAALFLAANLAGCGREAVPPGPAVNPPAPPGTPAGVVTPATDPGDNRSDAFRAVAPLFEHGEGRAATGCVVVSPPVFLSEEEAMQVIKEELSRHGIELSGDEVALPNIFPVDGIDPERRVAVEFVSRQDYFNFGGRMSNSTVQGYDLKEAARFAAGLAEAAKPTDIRLGIFYDPAGHLDDRPQPTQQLSWEEQLDAGRKESRRLLRAQVADFADWLQEQGAL